MKLLSLFLTALFLAAIANAQQFDIPAKVPITYWGQGCAVGGPASFSFGGELGAISSASGSGYGYINSPQTLGTAVPNKGYNMTVTGSGTPFVTVMFQPIDGCEIYINGTKTQMLQVGSANFSFSLRIETKLDRPQSLAGTRGGQCTSLSEDKASWFIGLGTLRNGRFAGALGFRATSITSDLWTTSALVYGNVDSSEISVTRDATYGYITQIQSRDVVLNVDSYLPGRTSYQIKACRPGSSTPFITYTVSQYGTTGIRIDKLEDGINWSTVLQQTGTTGWTLYDWQVMAPGATTFANSITTAVNGSTSTITYGTVDAGQMVKTKTYVTVGSRTELASVAMGGTTVSPKPTTTYSYYSSSTGSGWSGAVQSIVQPTGNWIKYDYFNGATDTRAGQIQRIYRPWLDLPADPSGANISSGYVETYDYTGNYDETVTAPLSRIVTVNGTTVGKTTWWYNWGYATINTHPIGQITETGYSSSSNSISTIIRTYLEYDVDTFFRGKLHSVTKPDGTKTSYAYYTGTWDAPGNCFTAATTGNDRLILAFHGQASPGTGLTEVYQSTITSIPWNIDSLYMANNLSTVTETVVDTNGRVVFSSEDVFVSAPDIERISGTACTYNGHNLLVTQKDIIRSVPGGDVAVNYGYSAGFLNSKTDVDGVQTTWHYDGLLRNDTITTAFGATGNYPATTQNFVYYSSGLKQTGQETPRDPTVTTYTYETSGRVLSESVPGPGSGTLTKSYSYPTVRQTTMTLPTSATKTTYLNLDGRVSRQTGTAQPDTQYSYSVDSYYTYAKTQLGFDQTNGWSETKSDWLGRPIILRTPEIGWASGNSKVVRKTYSYASLTGQLTSVSTTDEATSLRLLPDHLYVYGKVGMLVKEGDDLNNNGALDAASTDRIVLYNTFFFKDMGGFNGWLRDDQQQIYRTLNNSNDLTTVSETRTRFTRFNNGVLLGNYRAISDVSVIDASGRATLGGAWVDPVDHLRMQNHVVQGESQIGLSYWQDGYLESSNTASGVAKTYAYDTSGRLARVTEGTTGAEVTYAYYPNTAYQSTMTRTTGSQTTAATSYSYSWSTSRNSMTVTATDAAGGIANSEFNAMGLPWHTWGTAAQPTRIGYDAYGRRTTVTTWQSGSFTGETWPDGGNTVTWTLDPATGVATSKSYPNLSSVGFTYNARGQIATRTWARGATTTYNYFDTAGSQTGELRQVTYSGGTTPEVDYTYTRTGALAGVTDASGSRTFNYRPDLKLANEALDTIFYNGRSLTATYDSVPGRMNGYSFNGGVTVGLTLAYDTGNGRPITVTGSQGTTSTAFTLAYATGTDWVNSVTSGSYSRSLPLVSKNDVISNATTTWNGTQIGNFTASYADLRGLRNSQTTGLSAYTTALNIGSALTNTYLFDNYGQLTSSTGSAGPRSFAWTYDLAGNRLTDTTNSAVTNYTPGTLNQYTAIINSLGESPLTYDADGNLTQDSTWTYGYDGENRLKSMTRTSPSQQTLTFVYDYMGRRIRKTVTGTGASDTKFVWSGWQLVADLAANGYTVTRSFVWGPDFSDAHGSAGGAGSLLAQISGSAVAYAMPDALGNIVGYISGGSLAAAVEYSPFGRAINTNGTYSNYPIGFSGQYTDWETGLVYYGCRYYSPKHGRFINRDPIEEAGGLNLYGFCGNNGVNGFDSLGLDEITTSGKTAEYWAGYENQLAVYNRMLRSMYNHDSGNSGVNICGFLGGWVPGSDDPTLYNLDTGNPANKWFFENYNYYHTPLKDAHVVIENVNNDDKLDISLPGLTQAQLDQAGIDTTNTVKNHDYSKHAPNSTGSELDDRISSSPAGSASQELANFKNGVGLVPTRRGDPEVVGGVMSNGDGTFTIVKNQSGLPSYIRGDPLLLQIGLDSVDWHESTHGYFALQRNPGVFDGYKGWWLASQTGPVKDLTESLAYTRQIDFLQRVYDSGRYSGQSLTQTQVNYVGALQVILQNTLNNKRW